MRKSDNGLFGMALFTVVMQNRDANELREPMLKGLFRGVFLGPITAAGRCLKRQTASATRLDRLHTLDV